MNFCGAGTGLGKDKPTSLPRSKNSFLTPLPPGSVEDARGKGEGVPERGTGPPFEGCETAPLSPAFFPARQEHKGAVVCETFEIIAVLPEAGALCVYLPLCDRLPDFLPISDHFHRRHELPERGPWPDAFYRL